MGKIIKGGVIDKILFSHQGLVKVSLT